MPPSSLYNRAKHSDRLRNQRRFDCLRRSAAFKKGKQGLASSHWLHATQKVIFYAEFKQHFEVKQ